jgi:hypothetical protein
MLIAMGDALDQVQKVTDGLQEGSEESLHQFIHAYSHAMCVSCCMWRELADAVEQKFTQRKLNPLRESAPAFLFSTLD